MNAIHMDHAIYVSPAMFAESVAPFLKRRIAHVREFTEARFFHHTCGSVHALIPTLIDCGVEILNPIQPGVPGMEPWRLKRDFGDRLTFYGGVDTQYLLPRGTPEEVATAARDLVTVLGRWNWRSRARAARLKALHGRCFSFRCSSEPREWGNCSQF